jgi:mannose-6-phosphate isomerase-like protein (cupin superfamily)
MNEYIGNIEALTLENTDFRRVLYTTSRMQLVLMSIAPGEDIGEEVHDLDQFLRFEAGEGMAIINGVSHILSDGIALIVPAGATHNIINTSSRDHLKLYTIYAPAEHRHGVVHKTRAEALVAHEHFDGETG